MIQKRPCCHHDPRLPTDRLTHPHITPTPTPFPQNSAHQYDYDAQTVIAFLKTYGLDQDFKINIEPNHTTLAGHAPEHDIIIASQYGMLGSIDANTGACERLGECGVAGSTFGLCASPIHPLTTLGTQKQKGNPSLGWDTDNFLMNPQTATLIMKTVLEQGGIAPGGLNFDAKVCYGSREMKKGWRLDGGWWGFGIIDLEHGRAYTKPNRHRCGASRRTWRTSSSRTSGALLWITLSLSCCTRPLTTHNLSTPIP